MKKILLTLIAGLGLTASANAQLRDGSVFPDFTLTDIYGVDHNLYTYLNSGKTVFICVGATWNAESWAYRNTHALDSIWAKHGPIGQSGVLPTSTDNAMVLFFQGDNTTHLAQLYGNTAGGAVIYSTTEEPKATVTQGNWVSGIAYPIIDDTTSSVTTAMTTAWGINAYPTVYMICRDHLVRTLIQPTEAQAYAAATAGCPNYAPATSGVDAKPVFYGGATKYFACNATPTLGIQNYSSSMSITAATVTVKDGAGTTLATIPYTGTLAPYAVGTVSVPSFAGTALGGYKYSVSVTGDTRPTNDVSADSVFKVYVASNMGTLPVNETFTSALSYRYSLPYDGSVRVPGAAWAGATNPANTITNKLLQFDFYSYAANTGVFDFMIGNFNTTGIANLNLQFDQAYALYNSTAASDAMAVKVSTDCGATWSTAWTATGATLTTAAPKTSAEYFPAAAADWKHRIVNLTTYEGANMMVKLTGTSAHGNNAWITNLRLGSTTSINELPAISEINVFPNPAKDIANISLQLSDAALVNVQVYDATGRMVTATQQQLNAGMQTIAVSTANLATGAYYVKVISGTDIVTKQLSVIK